MTHLSQAQIAYYQKNGFIFQVGVFSEKATAKLRNHLEQAESKAKPGMKQATRKDLLITHAWAWDLVHDHRIVDPISDVLGPNVLLWSMDWFIKEPGPSFVSYHQDATYWGLYPHHVATAWIALSDAGPKTGPMKFIPESHKGPLYEQDDTFEGNNLLSRGQHVKTEVNEKDSILATLSPGEMSIHDVRTIHGSGPNTTTDRRIGMALRYCATNVKQTKTDRDRAILVAGEDHYQHFEMIPRPIRDMNDKALSLAHCHSQTRTKALMDTD